MHGNVSSATGTAIVAASANGSVSEITSASGSDGDDWFGGMARPLLGKEPGVELHYITGLPVGTCAKYVAKTEVSRRQPSGYFLRALLRSEQGEPFFRALMDGCKAQWWQEFQRHERMGRKADEAR